MAKTDPPLTSIADETGTRRNFRNVPFRVALTTSGTLKWAQNAKGYVYRVV